MRVRSASLAAPLGLGWQLVLASVSGALMALAFPPVGASVLAPVAVALLVLACFQTTVPRGMLIAGVQGMVGFMILLRWVALVGGDAWVLLSGLCAAWFALMGLGIALVTRVRWWIAWVPCIWVLQEALRDRIPWNGFSWGRLAFAQTATSLTPWAAVAGAPAVTFVTALAGTLLAAAILAFVGRAMQRGAVLLASLVMLAASGLLIPRPTDGQSVEGPGSAVAAAVQGGVEQTGLGDGDDRHLVLERHVAATQALAQEVAEGQRPQPAFVIWPENASDLDPYDVPDAGAAIGRAAQSIQAPLLVGAVIAVPDDPEHVANVGIVWDPASGPGQVYVKTHPVPFGEFIPFRSVLAQLIGRFDRIPRDFIAGTTPGVLDLGPVRIGDVICFEVADDAVVRDAVTGGGRAIVVQTNNATFAGLGQPEQQVAMSRLRAVEHGRAVIVAATSGISTLIDPAGRVQQELPEGAVGSLVGDIALRDSLTLSDRVGALPEWAAAVVGVAAMLVGLRAGRRPQATGEPLATASA